MRESRSFFIEAKYRGIVVLVVAVVLVEVGKIFEAGRMAVGHGGWRGAVGAWRINNLCHLE